MRLAWVCAVLLIGSTVLIAQKEEAAAAAKASDWKRAEALYQQVVEREPQDGVSWYQLGAAALQNNDLKIAAGAFEQSLKLKTRVPFSLYNLACTYARMGDRDKAFTYLDSLAKVAPAFGKALETDPDAATLRSDPRYPPLKTEMKKATTPCEYDAESRKFDFWIGDWDVFGPGGQKAGTSHIERSLDGCLLIENWEDRLGGTGKSFNTYNAGTKKWQQFWVESDGAVTSYEGEFRDGSMRFLGTNYTRKSAPAMVRMTFTPLDGGKVRQMGESTSDGGKTWTTSYDLTYVKK